MPLMVRGPGVPANAVRQELVLNNDFAPTIADLAGASTPAVRGWELVCPAADSLAAPLLAHGLLGGRVVPERADCKVPTHKSVHTQDHMFTEYIDTGERELYDLNADPYQLESKPRAGNEQLYSTLQTRLNALRACSGDRVPQRRRVPRLPSPRVTNTSPNMPPQGLAPSANLTATFSEKMDPLSITNPNLQALQGQPRWEHHCRSPM